MKPFVRSCRSGRSLDEASPRLPLLVPPGTPVKHEQTVEVDSGVVALTQHAIYFGGRKRSMRVPYAKLVSVVPYSDGIGLQKNGLSAKPLTPLDGWFAYNLVKTLAANVA